MSEAREPLLEPAFLRALERLAIAGRRPRDGRMQGERRSPRRGRSVELADYRPYVPGDDLRQIDWRAFARLERFFLKLFVEERDATLHLLIDRSASMAFGEPSKLRFARRLAAALGYLALCRPEWAVAMGIDDGPFARPPALRGRARAPQLFARLEAMEPQGGTDLRAALARYRAAVPQPGPLVLIGDLYDPAWRAALRSLSGGPYDPILVQVLSPEELSPSLDGDFLLRDAETGEAVEISADADLLARYRRRLRAWQEEIDEVCRGRGIPYVPVRSDAPLERFVLDRLRAEGVLV